MVQPQNKVYNLQKEIFICLAEVIDRKMIEPIPMICVKPVSRIEKIERRSFFRMDCRLPVQYHIIESIDTSINEGKPLLKCYTKDISGGGIRIITDTAFESGTEIQAYLVLEREICFVGTVKRSIQICEKGKIMYETGIEYKHIENRDRKITVRSNTKGAD